MKIAFILYDGITMLDFIGIYDPLTRLKPYIPEIRIETCAITKQIKDSFGLTMAVDHVENDLAVYDLIIIPGGFGTRERIQDDRFMKWVKTACNVPLKASICTGSLVLGASGMLKERRATTHFDEYVTLSSYCDEVVKERIVHDQDVITAGAVSSSLDLGLYLCQLWTSDEVALAIRKRMDYHG